MDFRSIAVIAFSAMFFYILPGAVAQSPKLMLPTNHAGMLTILQYSPDGNLLATSAEKDNEIRIWDVRTVRLLYVFTNHKARINSLHFNSTSRQLVSASLDSTYCLWNLEEGSLIRQFKAHRLNVVGAAFTPDDKKIVTFSYDEKVKLWDVASAKLLSETDCQLFYGWSKGDEPRIFFTPNSDHCIIGTAAKTDIFTLRGDIIRLKTSISTGNAIMHTDKRSFWTTSSTGAGIMSLVDVNTGKTSQNLDVHKSQVRQIDYSPNGKSLITSSWDGTARIWNSSTFNPIRALSNHDYKPSAVASIRGGKYVLSYSDKDSLLRIWSLVNATVQSLSPGIKNIRDIVPVNDHLVILRNDDTILMYDIEKKEIIYNIATNNQWFSLLHPIEFSPDKEIFAFLDKDDFIKLYKTHTGEKLTQYPKAISTNPSYEFLPIGSSMFLRDYSNGLLWNYENNESILVSALEYSTSNGKYIVCTKTDDDWIAVSVANIEKNALKDTMILGGRYDGTPNQFVLSPDESMLAVVYSYPSFVRLFDRKTNQPVSSFNIRDAEQVSFSPDGKQMLVQPKYDENLEIRVIPSGLVLQSIPFKYGGGKLPSFSDDGRYILSSGKIFDVLSGDEVFYDQATRGVNDIERAGYLNDSIVYTIGKYSSVINLWNSQSLRKIKTLNPDDSDNFISQLLVSPNGETMISSDIYGEETTIWDAFSKLPIDRISGYSFDISSVSYDSSARKLLWLNKDGTALKLSQVANCDFTTNFSLGPKRKIQHSFFSSDHSSVFAAGSSIKKWNASTGQPSPDFKEIEGALYAVDPQKKRALVGKYLDPELHGYDLKSGDKLFSIYPWTKYKALDPVFSPDGSRFILNDYNYDKEADTLRMYDATTGRLIFKKKMPFKYGSQKIFFRPDGKMFFASGYTDSTTIVACNSDNGNAVYTKKFYNTRTSDENSAQFFNGGKQMAFELAGIYHLLNTDDGTVIPVSYPDDYTIKTSHIIREKKTILTTSEDRGEYKYIRAWAFSGQHLFAINTKEHITEYGSCKNGRIIYSVHSDSIARFWDGNSGRYLYSIRLADPYNGDVALSDDGSWLCIVSEPTKQIFLYNTRDFSLFKKIPFSGTKRGYLSINREYYCFFDSLSKKFWYYDNMGDKNGFVSVDLQTGTSDYFPGERFFLNQDNNALLVFDGASDNNRLKKIPISPLEPGGTMETSGQILRMSFSEDGSMAILGQADGLATIWDLKNTRLVQTISEFKSFNESPIFTKDKKYMVTVTSGKIALFSVATGKKEIVLEESEGLSFSGIRQLPDTNVYFLTDQGGKSRLWNGSGKLLYQKDHPSTFFSDVKSIGNNRILFNTSDSSFAAYDLVANRIIKEFKDGVKYLFDFQNSYVIDSTLYLSGKWKTGQGRLLLSTLNFTTHLQAPRELPTIAFQNSPSDDGFLTLNDYGKAVLWTPSFVMASVITDDDNTIERISFTPSGNGIFTASNDTESKVWERATGKYLGPIKGLNPSSKFYPIDRGRYFLAQDRHSVSIFDLKSHKQVCLFSSIDSSFIAILENGYYFASKDLLRKLYWVKGLKTFGFDQLDERFNRPDKVLESLSLVFNDHTNRSLIEAFQMAYKKRIQKLGIDTTKFQSAYSVPELTLQNRNAISSITANEKLTLNIKASDQESLLSTFNIWVNDVPVFGSKGIRLDKSGKTQFDTICHITLSAGDNRVETSVINANGIESYRSPLIIKYVSPRAPLEKVYFVGIGIDKFAESRYNLAWSVKDIRDLSTRLKDKYGDLIDTLTLANEEVTVANIKSVKEKLSRSNVNDKVIIAYSGHGLLNKDYDYFLSTYNVNFKTPEENGLPYGELEALLDGIGARKKLLLIDACHSGEVDKEDLKKITRVQAELDSTKRGFIVIDTSRNKLGTRRSFELMQQLFVNIGKSTGSTIISAAAGTQFALERSDLKNGVFTYSILEYMKKHEHAKLSDLKNYVYSRVLELTKGLQRPTARAETLNVDWLIW